MEAHTSSYRQSMFLELKKLHDEAYTTIEYAIQLEEAGEKDRALARYQAGLKIIGKALNIRIECPSNPDVSWERAFVMMQKMKKTRQEVLGRFTDSQKSPKPSLSPSLPPLYDEAMSASSSSNNVVTPSRILTYSELGAALQNLKVETGAHSARVLYTYPNVQIYFISRDGTVNAVSEPDTLKIVELEGGERPGAYLQVGEWIYPLVPGVSSCLKTEYGAFISPDLHSPEEGAAVGIILPEEADDSVHELLNNILRGIVESAPPVLKLKRVGRQRHDLTSFISQRIVENAHLLSQRMVQGAQKTGQFMNYGTPKLLNYIQPEQTPTAVDPDVQTGLRVAKSVTEGAVTVTGYMASHVSCATMALGRYLAPHIQRQGTRLLSSSSNYTEQEASDKVGGVLQVAAGAVEGFYTVLDGLGNAAKILGNSLTTNTVKIVQHKYGQQAGAATSDTLYTVGNALVVGTNIKHLTLKGLLKTTAKQTGKAVFEDYRVSLQKSGGVNNFHAEPSSKVD